MSDDIGARAMALVAQIQADSELADVADAIGWVVVSRDDEYGRLYLSGLHPTPEAALIAAAEQHVSLHRGHPPGEPGWTLWVYPLHPPG